MLRKLTKDIAEVVASNTSLNSYLNSLHSNQPVVERSWLWDGKNGRSKFMTPEQVKKAWMHVLVTELSDGDVFHARILELEKSQLEKYGPQGGHPPIDEVLDDKVIPSWTHGYGSLHIQETAIWDKAKEIAFKQLASNGIVNLRPMLHGSVAKALQAEQKLTTNSGYPDFKTRNIPEVLQRAIDDAESGKWRDYVAIPLFRYYNGKLRLVWMYALASNLNEASYCKVVTERILTSPLVRSIFAPWAGFDAVKALVTATYKQNPNCYIAAADYSSTDQHFVAALSSEACDVLEQCFQRPYREGLRESLMAMHKVPLLISDSEMITGWHGVASGSEWTNFIETVSFMVGGNYVALRTNNLIRPLFGQGDDSAWLVDKSISENECKHILEEYGREIGQEIKAEKTMAKEDYVKTLQRLIQKGYYVEDSSVLRGVYPTIRALKSLIYPERWHLDDKQPFDKFDFAVRCFQILENTCDHPLFTQFCQFVLGGNKFLIDFAMAPDTVIDKAYARSKRFSNLVSTYNVEYANRKLSKFKAIQAARSVLHDKL